jgi:hypothetical protein
MRHQTRQVEEKVKKFRPRPPGRSSETSPHGDRLEEPNVLAVLGKPRGAGRFCGVRLRRRPFTRPETRPVVTVSLVRNKTPSGRPTRATTTHRKYRHDHPPEVSARPPTGSIGA